MSIAYEPDSMPPAIVPPNCGAATPRKRDVVWLGTEDRVTTVDMGPQLLSPLPHQPRKNGSVRVTLGVKNRLGELGGSPTR